MGAKIIGTKKGEQVSRPQVVKKLWAYLKEKDLQDKENRQWFTPDKTWSLSWLRAPEVLWDVEAPEGTPHEPRQLVPDVKSCIFLTFVTNTANALWRGNYCLALSEK